MLPRLAVFLVLLAPLGGSHGEFRAADSLAGDLIPQAAARMGNTPARSVLSWIRQQPTVRSAQLGRDGRTVDIRFADGTEGAILPRFPASVAARQGTAETGGRPRLHDAQGAKAIVLEPFASELYLGPDAGTAESTALRSAGFSVVEESDGAVSVTLMDSLSQYSVVYILTHSGVNAQGEGVIATGQVAQPDPAVKPLLDDHTVIVVGIAGSDAKYYGVLSGYFTHHSGEFPTNSLFFVNGCSMLRGTLVWQALAARGVRAMVSWDNEAMDTDDAAASQEFFQSLGTGENVAGAVSQVIRSGHGQSVVNGVVGRIGYLGDGDFTLQDILNPPPPTAAPTITPTASPPPSNTATVPVPGTSPVPGARVKWPTPLPWRTAIGLIPHS